MKVEIYSDVVCPWCYIGEARFGDALEGAAAAEDIEVVYRPYQLDPSAPAESVPLKRYLEDRYGASAARMRDHAGAAARDAGLEIDWDRAIAANTFDAHRLLMLAEREGAEGVQRRLAGALFEAHFVRGLDVSDHGVLADLAAEAGLDRDRAASFLESGEAAHDLRRALDQARGLGIRAVPSFVFEQRYLVEGAQPPETFREVIGRVAAESADADAAEREDADVSAR